MGCRAFAGLLAGSVVMSAAALALADDPAPEPAPAAAPEATAKAAFPDEWFFYGNDPRRRMMLKRTDGYPAPEFKVDRWIQGDATTMQDLRGNIVVLDFWGTWCAPCLAALPHTQELSQKFADKKVQFVAICDGSRGAEKAPAIVSKLGLNFRVAVDKGKSTYAAFYGQWYPFYVLVDREGIMRASGLTPQALESAIEALLVEQPPSDDPPAAPASTEHTGWLEGSPAQRLAFAKVEGAPAIGLTVVDWRNSEPLDVAELKGKVVLLDFWGTWCPHCLQSVPRINEIQNAYADKGLVVIGVCHSKNAAQMPEIAEKYGIAYPIAADTAGATFKAYRVNGTPDYYLIDRHGVVRYADLANEHLEDAVKSLLAEPGPAAMR